ncbi:MAG: Gldg family protein [Acidobacteria bacterium]|nr:Gldg family protein [Acidobacteriota bacterium]
MSATDTKTRYGKFLLYIIIIVLINLAGVTLFTRIDLTRNQIYSISDLTKEVVSNLSEPLTIEVFFTKDLGAPYNTVELSLRDLLQEYAVYGNRNFNYRFYDVSPDEGDITEDARRNRELAQSYGIFPVQLQIIEADQVKVQKAYMGMVMIHGDLMEKIPFIESTEGLEYTLTTMIQKMHNKTGVLMKLETNIRVKLFLSSSLEMVAPYVRLSGLSDIPKQIEQVVNELNEKNFGKLEFQLLNPSLQPEARQEAEQYNLLNLQWPALQDISGDQIPAGQGVIGMVMEYGDKIMDIPVLRVLRLPIFGTRYELVDMETIKESINENVENLIDINEDIGYLADHGTLDLQSFQPMPNEGQNPEAVSEFNKLVSGTYSLKEVRLADGEIPPGIRCLIIARAKEEFTDYELFQIDQFLMKGNSLAVFVDAFNEIRPPQQQMQFNQQGPFFVPLNTGLEKLLDHYGINAKKAYVLDKSCFTQRFRSQTGIEEMPIYFAPRIKAGNINQELDFLKNINDLLALQFSPLELRQERLQAQGVEALRLFSSSEESWEMSGRINLNPMFIQPPTQEDAYSGSLPLAYLLQGEFSSYFTGKELPVRPADQENVNETGAEAQADQEKSGPDLSSIEETGVFLSQGSPGKIFLVGTSTLLRNDVINWQVEGENRERIFPNQVFLMNVLDILNGREELAIMRAKKQSFNPLDETEVGTRNFIKTLNVGGLALLVLLAGVWVWFRRNARKKRIQLMFQK